jgi:uncharacterized protein YegL
MAEHDVQAAGQKRERPREAAMSDDLVLRYKDNNSQRTPCVLVLDGSMSMAGQPIDELNRGLKVLEEELKEDVVARTRVRVLVIRVGGPPEVVGDWTDAIEFTAPSLAAGGNTPLGEAMQLALHSVAEEKRRLDAAGISSTRPWIFMISDGAPTDPGWQAAAEGCVQAEQAKQVAVFPIGVSGADLDALGRFSPRGAAQLDGLRFTDFFLWLSRSVSTASQSGPEEDVQLPATDWARAPT